MGKKYIIELPENTHWIQWIMEGTKDHHPYMDFKQVEDLIPYTEPDLEQVRKEAYEEGKKQAKAQAELDVCHDIEKVAKDNYKAGLADAWEAARKIIRMPEGDLLNLFDVYSSVCTSVQVILKYDASEAIAKIKGYEDGKQEYHVGDEFENGNGKKFIVLKMDGKEIDRYIDGDGKTYVMDVKYRVMRKTGRHFPEIATVLEKMRGEKE